MTYRKCCEDAHDRGEAVEPMMLLKARYSAYAYCLPEFIISTTHKKSPEWVADEKEWEEELLLFCNTYDFYNERRQLGLVIEDCRFDGKKKAQLLFKALMLNKGKKDAKVELWEKSMVVQEDERWMYQEGALVEYAGPLM